MTQIYLHFWWAHYGLSSNARILTTLMASDGGLSSSYSSSVWYEFIRRAVCTWLRYIHAWTHHTGHRWALYAVDQELYWLSGTCTQCTDSCSARHNPDMIFSVRSTAVSNKYSHSHMRVSPTDPDRLPNAEGVSTFRHKQWGVIFSLRNARIKHVGQCQSCMIYQLRIILKRTRSLFCASYAGCLETYRKLPSCCGSNRLLLEEMMCGW